MFFITIDEAIIQYLLSQNELTSLINDKIFPDIIPKEAKLPSVSMQLVDSVEKIVMSGHNAEMESIFQFNIKTLSKTEAVTILETIKKIFRSLFRTNDFNGYKLNLVEILGRLPSSYSENTYIERFEVKFYHDYISI